MRHHVRRAAATTIAAATVVLGGGALAGCAGAHGAAGTPATPGAFTVATTPAGAAVETSYGYRCTTPCRLPLGRAAYVATVTMTGYKPVQVPVAPGRDPGALSITLQPQDPGGAAPVPARAR